MRTRLAVPALALALVAASARAEEDDAAFARALAQRGYGGLAERVLERLATSGPPARRGEGRLLLAQLRRAAATRAARGRARLPDDQVQRLFRDAEEAYAAAMKDETSARAARLDLARLLCIH